MLVAVGLAQQYRIMSTISLGPLVLLQPLWLIPAIVFFILCFKTTNGSRKNDWRRVLSAPVYQFLAGDTQSILRVNIALLTAALISMALTEPVVRQSDDDTWRHSIGWIAVVDVSRSMTLDDTVPSRLSAARDSLSVLSRRSGSRPIALIIYSGDAFLVAPPAFDKSLFDEHAALLEHGVIPTEGSNLARALSLSSSVIAESQFIAARVFLLGDSGGIGEDAMAAARFLGKTGHRLDVLVYGKQAQGSTDNTDLQTDPAAAMALATAGNGISLQASAFGELDYEKLGLDSHASASTLSELHTLVWSNQSHWLLLLGVPLLLLLFKQEHRA